MNKKLLYINIQLFASDERTEKPTARRRRKAREEGQVLQSKEISSAILLLLAFYLLKYFGSYMYHNMASFMKKVMTEYISKDNILEGANLWNLFIEVMVLLLKTVAPIIGIIFATGLIISYAQVGFLFTTKTLQPKLGKLNPIHGFKRMFSVHAVFELVKSLIKVVIVTYVAYSYVKDETSKILLMMDMDMVQITAYMGDLLIGIALKMGMALIILGCIDYFFQWRRHEKSLMMTKEEVKEEFKQIEGNPQIKSRIKQKQREISLRRMMSEIPKADVVITNPTHFAVALKYDADVAPAPVVIAKGQDYIAQRIKEIAKEHQVEIVENKLLARALYESTEIGETIPPELYQAVAEVLAFVYSLKNKTAV